MLAVVLAMVAVASGIAAWVVDRRRRAYLDRPTTPAAAVFAGRNEVKGRAWTPEPLTSRRTETACVWWSYELEEEREHTRTVTDTDSEGRSRTRTETYRQWHTIDERSDLVSAFEVVDHTGRVEVRTAGARFEPMESLAETFRRDDDRGFLERMFSSDGSTGRYRETEQVLPVGAQVFVVAEAEMDAVSATPVLTRGRGFLLISTKSEESRTSKLGFAVVALALVMVGTAIAAGGLALGGEGDVSGPGLAAGGAAAALALAAGAALVMRNRLLIVAESAERALSLVGVQLQRRADLIPQMAGVVEAASDQHAALLTSVAELRTSLPSTLGVDAAENATVGQNEAAHRVVSVVEAMPELVTSANWRRLMDEMTDCEDRIAASQTFYNDAVTIMHDRRRTFPGRLFVPWLPRPGTELFSATGIERSTPARPLPFDD